MNNILSLPIIIFSLLANSSFALGDSIYDNIYAGAKAGGVYGHNACEYHNLSCDNNSVGGGVFVGYELNDWLAIEAAYNHLGEMKADYPALKNSNVLAPYTGKVRGVEIGIKPYFDLNDNISLFAKAGTLGWWTDVVGNEVDYQYTARDTGFSPMLGVGFEIGVTSHLSARMEYQLFHNVGGSTTQGSSINLLSVGLNYRFGNKPVPSMEPVASVPAKSNTVVPAQPKPHRVEVMTHALAGELLFGNNDYAMAPAFIDTLHPILARLLDYPQALLTIETHTDSRGSLAYNQALSERRAMSVKNYFIKQGIAEDRLTIDAKGETMPIADNATEAGRAKNRRVHLLSPAFIAAPAAESF